MAASTNTSGENHRYDILAQEQSELRITPADLRNAMDGYDGSADLWQTYTLDGMNLYDVLQQEAAESDYVLEIGCNSGETTQELDRLLDGSTVTGLDLYRDGSFKQDGPSYVQAEASYLPFKDDSLDFVVAPSSLGAILKMGILHEVSRVKRRENETISTVLEDIAPDERSTVRNEWADACVSQYVEQVLDDVGQAMQDGGNLLLADGQMYLLADHTDGDWTAVEGRGYVKDWEGGGETVRRAEDYYRSWMEEMDVSDYTEKTHVRRITKR